MKRMDRVKAAQLVGHRLKLHELGGIDEFAYEGAACNGPECILCGQAWCYHCHPLGPAWGCQAGYGSTRNALVWLLLRMADKGRRVLREMRR
jgi:hypothetical protein